MGLVTTSIKTAELPDTGADTCNPSIWGSEVGVGLPEFEDSLGYKVCYVSLGHMVFQLQIACFKVK